MQIECRLLLPNAAILSRGRDVGNLWMTFFFVVQLADKPDMIPNGVDPRRKRRPTDSHLLPTQMLKLSPTHRQTDFTQSMFQYAFWLQIPIVCPIQLECITAHNSFDASGRFQGNLS